MARGGGRRGLVGLIGQGVGVAAEYREHRKQQKEARSASQQAEEARIDGPSTRPSEQQIATKQDLPPDYAEQPQGSEVSVSVGEPASTSGKRTPSPFEGDSDFDSETSSLRSLEDDEEDWELDEAMDTPPPSIADSSGLPTYEESESMTTVDDLVKDVLIASPPLPAQERFKSPQSLPCPVIIPQRRPRKKARGFVRAYAPVLENCGVDQKTFLSFLKNFHKASQSSPVFTAVRVSAGIAGFAPSVIAMAVCTAVQVAAGVGAEVQTRARTNDFLDRMNEQLFKPAGLYAMIVKYKTDADVNQAATGPQALLGNLIRTEQVDMSANQVIAKYARTLSGQSSGNGRSMSERMQGLRLASDTTHGTIELPEAAPLIFPDLDHKLDHEGPETFKDKANDAKKFIADYIDRRAQMQYAMQDPNSSLTVPGEQRAFKSKLADPNHPMHSGGLVTLLSAGTLTPRQAKRDRRRGKLLDRDTRRIGQGRELRKEDKRVKRYGDEYLEELAARTGGRSGRRGGLLGGLTALAAARGSAGAFGGSGAATPDTAYDKQSIDYEDTRRGSGRSYDARAGNAYGEGSSRDIGGDGDHGMRSGGQSGRQKRGVVGAVKRIIREDVLYLMIVNMPSEMELEEAMQQLEMAKVRS